MANKNMSKEELLEIISDMEDEIHEFESVVCPNCAGFDGCPECEQYQNDINSLENDIEEKDEEIKDLETEISDLEYTQIDPTQLEAITDTLEDALNNLNDLIV